MATDSWIGGGGDWDDPSRWQGGVVPTAADTASFTVAGPYTVTISSPLAIAVDDISLTANVALDVAQGASLALGGTLTGNGGQLRIEGTVSGGTLSGYVLLDGGTIDGVTLGPAASVYADGTTEIDGDSVVNAGTITLDYGTLDIDPQSFTNNGGVVASAGSTLTIAPGTFTNLVGGTLTGGRYDAEGNLDLPSPVVTLDADLTLGAGGKVVGTAGSVAIENSLTTIGPDGALRILGDRDYSSSGTLDVAGLLELGGGTLSTRGITVGASGIMSGYGTVSGGVDAAGTVAADGGTLKLDAGTGGGQFVIDPGATLELGGTTGVAVSFGGNVGTLLLDDARDFGGSIAGLAAGDTITLAGETITGVSLAGDVLAVATASDGQLSFDLAGDLAGLTFDPHGATLAVQDLAQPTLVWQPIGSDLWSDTSGWRDGTVPTTGDNVAIVAPGAYTVEIAAASPAAASSVTLDSAGATLQLDGNASLAVGDTLEIGAGQVEMAYDATLQAGTVTLDGGRLDVGVDATLQAGSVVLDGGVLDLDVGTLRGAIVTGATGNLLLDYATLDDVGIDGPLRLAASDAAFVSDGMTVTGAAGAGDGEIDLAKGAYLELDSGTVQLGTAGGTGTVNLSGDDSRIVADGGTLVLGSLPSSTSPGAPGTINLSGDYASLELNGGGLSNVDAVDITGAGASFRVDGTGSLDGPTIGIGGAQGAALLVSSGTGPTTLTLGPGTTIDQIGTYAEIEASAGGGGSAAIAMVALDDAASPPSPSPSGIVSQGQLSAEIAGGQFDIDGPFTNEGKISVGNGDTLTFAGIGPAVVNARGARIDIDAATVIVDFGSTWQNQGTVDVGADGLFDLRGSIATPGVGAQILVEASGTLQIEGDVQTASLADVVNDGVLDLTGTLDNGGAVLTPGSGGLGTIDLDQGGMIGGGELNDSAGGLRFDGGELDGVTIDGTLTVGDGEVLHLRDFAGANVTVETGGTLILEGNSIDGTIDPADWSNIQNAGGTIGIDGTIVGADLDIGTDTGLGQVAFEQNAIIDGGSITNEGGTPQFHGATFDGVDYEGSPLTIGDGQWLWLENFTASTEVDVQSGGELYLYASPTDAAMTTAELGGITNEPGGLVGIEGWLDNTGATLTLGTGQSLGQVVLDFDGTIAGGTIADTDGQMLFQGGTLDGVSYGGMILLGNGESLRMDDWVVGQAIDVEGGELDLFGSPPPSPAYAAPLDITLGSGVLGLNGHIGTAALAGTTNTGGQVLVFGTLDNTGQTLGVGGGGQLGQVELEYGAEIDGGSIVDLGLGLSMSSGSTVTLSGVTYEGTLSLSAGGTFYADGLTMTGVDGTGPGEIDVASPTTDLVLSGGLTIGNAADPGRIAVTGNFDQLQLDGTETIDDVEIDIGGTGIPFNGGTTIAAIDPDGNGGIATLGANATVSLEGGAMTFEAGSATTEGLVNEGTIDTNQVSIDILGNFTNASTLALTGQSTHLGTTTAPGSSVPGSFVNTGNITISGGDLYAEQDTSFASSGSIEIDGNSFLELGSASESWSNAGGTITVGDGTGFAGLEMYGSVTTAELGDIKTTANAFVAFYGALDNTGATLDVGSGQDLGLLTLSGASITGGTIHNHGGGFVYDGVTLDGVTYQGSSFDLSGSAYYDAPPIDIENGLTVENDAGTGPGTILLTGYYPKLDFEGTQTLDNVTIDIGTSIFEGSGPGFDFLEATSGAVLTLGAHTVIDTAGNNAVLDGAGAIIEAGAINATYTNGSFTIDPGTFTLQGSISVDNGTKLVLAPTDLTNLSGGTLSGGTWAVGAGSELQLAAGAAITTLDADLTLGGGGALLDNAGGGTLEASLTSIGSAGALRLLSGRNYTTTNALEIAGTLQLGGGTLSSGPVSIDADATLTGFGTLGGVENDGQIVATGGALKIGGDVTDSTTGSGKLTIAAGGELELGGAVSSGEDVSFGGAVGVLRLDDPSAFEGSISGLVAGDSIDLADTTVTGVGLSGSTLTVASSAGTLSFDVSGDLGGASFSLSSDGQGGTDLVLGQSVLAVPEVINASPIRLPDTRIGQADALVLAIENGAATGGGALDVSVGSTTGGLTVIGGINDLAPGQTGYLTVEAPSGTAGSLAGTVVLDFASDDGGTTTPLPAQTLDISGAVFRLASGSLSGPATAPIVHVDDTASETLTVSNTATADWFSENLVGTAVTAAGEFTATGATGDIAPGASSGAITVAIDTSAAGIYASPVSVDLASDGSGVDGAAPTGIGSQTVKLAATVDAYAKPEFETEAVAGTSSAQLIASPANTDAPIVYSLNLGTFLPDSPKVSIDLKLLNAAGLVADDLNGSFTVSPTVWLGSGDNGEGPPGDIFDQDGFTDFTGLSDTEGRELGITFDPVGEHGDNAIFSEEIVFHPYGSNASGYSGTDQLSPIAIDVTGSVSKHDPAEIETIPDELDFHDLHLVRQGYPSAPQTLKMTLGLKNGADSDEAGKLIAWAGGVEDGPAESITGEQTDPLDPGDSSPGVFTVTLPTPDPSKTKFDAGQMEGTVTIGGASLFEKDVFHPSPYASPLPYKEVTYKADVYDYAKPMIYDVTSNGHSAIFCEDGRVVETDQDLGKISSPVTIQIYASNTAPNSDYSDQFKSTVTGSGDSNFTLDTPSASPIAGGTQGVLIATIKVSKPSSDKATYTLTIGDDDISNVEAFNGLKLPDPTISFTAEKSDSPPPPPPPPPPAPPPGPNGGGGGGSGSTSGGWGDVHLTTFSGLHYDFQAAGEFVAAKATAADDPFEVQIRLQPTGTGASVTVTTQVATQVGTDKVTFDLEREHAGGSLVWIDGAAVVLDATHTSISLTGGTLDYEGPGSYRVDYAMGESLTVHDDGTYLSYGVQLPAGAAAGSVTGLDGVNGAAAGQDLVLGPGAGASAGTPLSQPIPTSELYGQYADSWRVTQAGSLFSYLVGQDTGTFTDRDFPAHPLTLADLPASVVSQAMALAQQAGITDPTLLQDAILDYAETSDPQFITGLANLQASGSVQSGATDAQVTSPPPANVVSVVGLDSGVTETPGAPTVVDFAVELTQAAASPLAVGYAVVDPGTGGYLGAAAFGTALPSGSVTFAAGEESASFSITVPTDALGSMPVGELAVAISPPADTTIAVGAALARTEVDNAAIEPGSAAQPVLEIVAGSGTLTQNGNDWTLDLGRMAAGASVVPVELAMANAAAAPADQLSGAASLIGGSAALTGAAADVFGGYTNLQPGQIGDAAILGVDTTAPGKFTETVSFSASESNASGYLATLPSQTLTVTVEIDPAAPVLAAPSASAVEGDSTTIAGSGDSGDAVTLFEDGQQVGTGSVTNGAFSITVDGLAEGHHQFTATQADGDLSSAASAAVSLDVDPAAPLLVPPTGPVVEGGSTTITGSGDSGDSVTLFEDGQQVGGGQVTNGAFSITVAGLAEGYHQFTATQADGDLSSAASAAVSLDVDPAAPSLAALAGPVVEGGSTTITGSGDSGDSVTLFEDGQQVGGGQVTNGAFSITVAGLAEGYHQFTATQADGDLSSAASAAVSLDVDPAAPSLAALAGPVVEGGSATITGSGDSGDSVTLFEDGQQVGTGSVTNGTFSITVAGLAEGHHQFTATQADGDLSSAASAVVSLDVGPAAPDLMGVVGQVVAGQPVTVSGTGDAGDTVTLYEGSTAVGGGVVGSGSSFTVTTTAGFAAGEHTLTATETAPDNLTSAVSAGLDIDVASSIGLVSSVTGTPNSGDLDAGQTVTIRIGLTAPVRVKGTPTLSLDDGGTASYDAHDSSSTDLVFTYRVKAGQNTPDLTVTGLVLGRSASITTLDGQPADLSGAMGPLGPMIDTAAPDVTGVGVDPATGTLRLGDTAHITLSMSEAVVVKGTPSLNLNDHGTATYDAAQSSATSLVFDYTAGAGQNTDALSISSVTLGHGGSIDDPAGNAASLGGADIGLGLSVDTHQSAIITGNERLKLGRSDEDVTFAPGAHGTLELDRLFGYSGTVSGLSAGDAIDLRTVPYINFLWFDLTATSYRPNAQDTGGTLSVSEGPLVLAQVNLLGNYMASSFVESGDGHGGTLITVKPQESETLSFPHG